MSFHACTLSDAQLLTLLQEDVPYGDLTTEALGIWNARGSFTFTARGAMTVCAIEEAARLLELTGLQVDCASQSGQRVSAGTQLLHAQGSAASLHRGWKISQILVETTSGIATAMSAIIEALQKAGLHTPVACTRKNLPGTKALASKAIRAGGGSMHRLGLSETVLIFPEHQLFLQESAQETVQRLKQTLPEKKIVVEVKDHPSALEWAQAGADVLQLEKFSINSVQECRQSLGRGATRPILAAAGGINAENAVAYSRAGADLLVTSSPYHGKPADVQVRFIAG